MHLCVDFWDYIVLFSELWANVLIFLWKIAINYYGMYQKRLPLKQKLVISIKITFISFVIFTKTITMS